MSGNPATASILRSELLARRALSKGDVRSPQYSRSYVPVARGDVRERLCGPLGAPGVWLRCRPQGLRGRAPQPLGR